MKLAETPFAVLRFQYQLARFPLQLIEDRVMVRLSAEAPARLLYEHFVGMLDAAVGRLLGDADLQKRGAALVERSDVLGRAAQLEASATRKRQQADEKLKSTSEDVVSDINEARDATEQEVVEARLTAAKQTQAADDKAEKRVAAAKQQADQAASQRAGTAEAAKRRKKANIAATEEVIIEAAEAKFDDAQAQRSTAARKRAQAKRTEELANTEQQKRRSERANNN
jgi:hypothetical protein